jgi:CHAD domain-containing protein
MNHKSIKRIISEKVSTISVLAEMVGKNFDKESIHDFRVEVKRLRSFLRLLRMHSDESKLKMPKKFKRLYQVAGNIRDAQLEYEKLLAENIELPEYLAGLKNKIELNKEAWAELYSKKILRKLWDRLTDFETDAISPALLEHFFSTRLAVVKKTSLLRSPSDKQVHEARKQIKDILYTSKIAKKDWKAGYSKTKNTPVKDLDYIADVIGGYNDERLMLEHLDSFSSPAVKKKEEKNLENLCDEEASRLMEEKEEILAMMRAFGKANSSGACR